MTDAPCHEVNYYDGQRDITDRKHGAAVVIGHSTAHTAAAPPYAALVCNNTAVLLIHKETLDYTDYTITSPPTVIGAHVCYRQYANTSPPSQAILFASDHVMCNAKTLQ